MKGKGRGRKRKSTEPPSSPPPVEQEVTTTLTQNSSGKFVPKFSKKTKTCNSQTVNTSVAPAFPLHEEIETLYSSSPLKSHDIPWQLYDSTSQSLTTSPSKSCDKLSQSHGNNCSLSRDVEHANTSDVEELVYSGWSESTTVIVLPIEMNKSSQEYMPGLSLSQATIVQTGHVAQNNNDNDNEKLLLQDVNIDNNMSEDSNVRIRRGEEKKGTLSISESHDSHGITESCDIESHDSSIIMELSNTPVIIEIHSTESPDSNVIYNTLLVPDTTEHAEEIIPNSIPDHTMSLITETNKGSLILIKTSIENGENNDKEKILESDHPHCNSIVNSSDSNSHSEVQLETKNHHGNEVESTVNNSSQSLHSISQCHYDNEETSTHCNTMNTTSVQVGNSLSLADEIHNHGDTDHVTTMGEDGIGEIAVQQLDDSLTFEDMEDMYLDFDDFNTKPVEQVHKPVKHVSNCSDTNLNPDFSNIIETRSNVSIESNKQQRYNNIATVPTMMPQRVNDTLTDHLSPFQDQSVTLLGLVNELSMLNQHILKCKREMETVRQQRNSKKQHRW